MGIKDAVATGDLDRARRLQAKSHELIEILLQTGVLEGLKCAMERSGVPVGPCRRPFRPVPADARARLDLWLETNMQMAA